MTTISAEELRHLTVEQKLQLIHGLWGQIIDQGYKPDIPASVLREAKQRLDEMRRDPSIGLTEEEMWAEVDRLQAQRRGQAS